MCLIIIILLILFLSIGIGILTKSQEKEIGEPIVFIGIEGVIAGIIGIFRFRKSD